MKKKYIILSVSLLAFALFLLSGCVYVTRSTQRDFCYEKLSDSTSQLIPLSGIPYCAELAPGLRFKFDTGADVSTLNVADAEKLRAMGYEVEEIFGPMMGRDGFGDYVLSAKRYRVTLPIGGYDMEVDSTGEKRLVYGNKPAALLRQVDFQKSDSAVSTLGLDVLSKFKLECLFDQKALVLSQELPQGYRKVVDMQKNIHLFDFLWSASRSYILVSVNQSPNVYLVDTGLQRAALKNPTEEAPHSKHNLRKEIITTMHHRFEALVDDEAWVDFGVRSGTKKVFYYSNTEDDYQMNPLNVFQQDLLIDIEGGGIYFRPTAS